MASGCVCMQGVDGMAHSEVIAADWRGAVASAGPVIRDLDVASGGAGMPKFGNLKGVAAPLDIQNVDTDMIIPKEYLKTIKKTGLGFAAFAELRYELIPTYCARLGLIAPDCA